MKNIYIAISFVTAILIVPATAFSKPPMSDPDAIKAILNQACVDMNNGKISGTTSYFAPNILVYDLLPPLISNAATVQAGNVYWHSVIDGSFHCKYEELQVQMLGANYAFSGSIIEAAAKLKTGKSFSIRMRSTDIWERTKDGWRAIHEHTSVPLDPNTGKGLLTLPLNTPTH